MHTRSRSVHELETDDVKQRFHFRTRRQELNLAEGGT
jgi:hypothetical protein